MTPRVTPGTASSAAPAAKSLRMMVAGPAQLQPIIELEARSFIPSDRFARATWRHLLGPARMRGSSLTLVALSGGHVVGALNALLRRDGHTARLYSLAVDPQERGRGIGGLLVRHLAKRLPPAFTVLSLEVRHDNAAARVLYERLGFTVFEHLPAYYPDGGDGVRLRASRAAVRRG
ncbi:MAG: GNAT family N-acetyltransferase [Planctomycetes bacterium]|nr:GNAT family N-acetyltransferase [Planctomycetota bacterium]